MPNVRGFSDEERQARVNALRGQMGADDVYSGITNKLASIREFGGDLARNAAGLPEAAGTIASSMAGQIGSGLGTGAAMLADVVRGGVGVGPRGLSLKKPDVDNAAETIERGTQRFTSMPTSEGGQAALEGLGTVMEPIDKGINAASDAVYEGTGSPLAGALAKGAFNLVDPEHAGAVVSALRGSRGLTNLIREAGPSAGVSSRGSMGKQRGAWTMGDIADTPGDFSMRSPTLEAFNRLKPQEQKNLSGKQLATALKREGAKKEELEWMGLDKVLDTDEVMSVADVKKLAEANEPKIEHAQARSGSESAELDDEKVHEAVSEAVSNDDDLTYPLIITHREPGSRRFSAYEPARGETFENTDQLDNWLDEHKAQWKADQETHYLENISDYLSEEDLAEMSDNQKQAWAQSQAEDSIDESLGEFSTEMDYDSEATNYQDLWDYHEQRVRESPEDYGLEGGMADAPDYGEYTVGQYGSEPEAKYTVATGKLAGEARFGRNLDEPGFLSPYNRAEEAMATAAAEGSPQMSLLTPDATQSSKAFQREALRRGQIAEDPNRPDYTRQSNLSHYRDMGKNQMYFTRETHRPAPDWGTVKEGVGRVDDTGLATAEAGELPEAGKDNPLALLEEAQSDWYQKGRKTGWADPKDIEKVKKQKVDREAQVAAFKQQAVGELDNLWRSPAVATLIERILPHNDYLSTKLKEWGDLQPGGARAHEFSPDELQTTRIVVGKQILRELKGHTDTGLAPEAAQLLEQTDQGLGMVDNMAEIPGAEDLTPTGPMRETPQYTQLAMADALRRAVQEGKQYFGWTPGDVHAHRWGSESMQFAPSAENPRVMRARFGGGRDMDSQPGTVLEKFQQRADELLEDGDPGNVYDYNLDDPELDKKLAMAVEGSLNYGMSDYPDPMAARGKRAALIRKQMEELATKAAAGERKAAHYSPRAVGYEQAYGPMEKHIIDILRRSGVKPPEIRDIMLKYDANRESEVPMRGFEIDPDLARAAKRGFILPY